MRSFYILRFFAILMYNLYYTFEAIEYWDAHFEKGKDRIEVTFDLYDDNCSNNETWQFIYFMLYTLAFNA